MPDPEEQTTTPTDDEQGTGETTPETDPPASGGGEDSQGDTTVADEDPVTTFTIITPAVGGGLGDKRVEIIKFDGTTGVTNFKSVPIFMCSDAGAVSYNASTGTVTVASAGATAMFVFKG